MSVYYNDDDNVNMRQDVQNLLGKMFNDPVHGCFSLPSYCVKVIDTPEFQRMRYIKQLQTTDHVYPGATHTRFAHSIGVCYLAGQVIRHLQKNQPELEISGDDVKCVMLAGLCHDLGHGPLSHYFTKILGGLGINKEHEVISAQVLDYFDIGLTKEQIALIKDLISGSNIDQRPPNRRFLYQIVANNENGVDVDKWDYFARDSFYLGMGQSFDHIRIIKDEMRVCECKHISKTGEEFETLEISFRDKRALKILKDVEVELENLAFQDFLGKHKLKLVIINHTYDFQMEYTKSCYFFEKKQEGSTQEDSSEIVKQADRREFPKLSSKVWEQDLRLYSRADKDEQKSMTFSDLLFEWKHFKEHQSPPPGQHEQKRQWSDQQAQGRESRSTSQVNANKKLKF